MKTALFLVFLTGLFGVFPAACTGQKKAVPVIAPMVNSTIYYTSDSIHYYRRDNKKPMNGEYIIYDVEQVHAVQNPVYETDAQVPVLPMPGSKHSTGVFLNGLKTGKWTYYNGKRKTKEEYYSRDKPVRVVFY